MMMTRGAVDEDLKNSVPSFARGLPILLVDHDISSLTSISSMLQSYSFSVTTAQSTTVAMSIIRDWNRDDQESSFKLIMAHLSMAKPEDLLFLRALVNKGIPLILISSDNNVTTAEKTLAEGASFFLEKPIGLPDLKYVWQHACQRRTSNPIRVDRPVIMRQERNTTEVPLPANSDNTNCNKTITDPNVKGKHNGKVAAGSSMRNILEPPVNRPEAQKREGSNSQKAMKRPLNNEKDRGVTMNKKLNNGTAEKVDSRKRKVPSDGKENDNTGGAAPGKKPRIVWTPDLHLKFTTALSTLGDQLAQPKSILQMMNVPNLTQRQVASHLQKYKSQVQQINLVGTDDAASLKEHLSSYLMPKSSHGFNRNRTSSGREAFRFGSGETPNLYLPPIGPFQVQEGYLYPYSQQANCFLMPMEPSRPEYPPSSASSDTGEKQHVSEAEGSKVSSPKSDLPKTSSPVVVDEDDMDYFSDLASILSPMYEMPINLDTEPLYGPSQVEPGQLLTVSTESSTQSMPALSPDLASNFSALHEPLFKTDHLIGETSEGYFMDSSNSTNSSDFLKCSNHSSPVENSDGFDELDDVKQYSEWFEELLQAPDEAESNLPLKSVEAVAGEGSYLSCLEIYSAKE